MERTATDIKTTKDDFEIQATHYAKCGKCGTCDYCLGVRAEIKAIRDKEMMKRRLEKIKYLPDGLDCFCSKEDSMMSVEPLGFTTTDLKSLHTEATKPEGDYEASYLAGWERGAQDFDRLLTENAELKARIEEPNKWKTT